MTDELNVTVICGSLRQASYNALIARNLPALAPPEMILSPSPSIASLPLYNADIQNQSGFPEAVSRLGEVIRSADGVMIVTPEYNYSVPGVLKNAIDWVSRLQNQPFAAKPVALQSASPSLLGGARAQYHLRQMLVFLDAFAFNKPEVFVTTVNKKVDATTGEITDAPTRDLIRQQLAEFAKFIVRLRDSVSR
jgi:chromate reductase